ncbi:MAG: nucleotidyltransferase domain-containing protein [archaeon]
MVYIQLEKTDIEILKYLVIDINKQFSINELSNILKRPYVKVHSSIQRLLSKNIININVLGKSHYCRLDYKNNLDIACFVEAQIARDFLIKNKNIHIFLNNLKEKLNFPDHSLIIFGSFARNTQTKNSDLDLAVITSKDNLEKAESIIRSFTKTTNINIHALEFAYIDFIEMLKSKELNVAKEMTRNHVIIYGFEQFYECIRLGE